MRYFQEFGDVMPGGDYGHSGEPAAAKQFHEAKEGTHQHDSEDDITDPEWEEKDEEEDEEEESPPRRGRGRKGKGKDKAQPKNKPKPRGKRKALQGSTIALLIFCRGARGGC